MGSPRIRRVLGPGVLTLLACLATLPAGATAACLRFGTRLVPAFVVWGEGSSFADDGRVTSEAPAATDAMHYFDGVINVTLSSPQLQGPPEGLRRPTLTGYSRDYLSLIFKVSRLAGAAVGTRPAETALHDAYSCFEFVLYETNSDIFAAVERGHVDAGHAAISKTPERMRHRRFTDRFFSASLSILVRDDRDIGGSTLSVLSTFVRAFLGPALVIYLLLTVIGAHLVWFAEYYFPHPERSLFKNTYCQGMWVQAFPWTARKLIGDTTVKGVPYGHAGSCAAFFITALALILGSFLFGVVSTAMQSVELQTQIAAIDDVPGHAVGSVVGTTSSAWLANEGSRIGIADVHLYRDHATVIEALRNGTVDVSIYDTPMQRYIERQEAATSAGLGLPAPFVTVGETFDGQDYAMVVDPNSTILNMLNLAIVATAGTAENDELNVRYFAPPSIGGGFSDSVGNLEVSSIAAGWGGGMLVAIILCFVVLYRVRRACRLGACRRTHLLPTTRPHRAISHARGAVHRTQTFLNAFSGRGHHFDARIAEMELEAKLQDRYLTDIETTRVGMKCSRDTAIKMMRLLDIVSGIQRQLDRAMPASQTLSDGLSSSMVALVDESCGAVGRGAESDRSVMSDSDAASPPCPDAAGSDEKCVDGADKSV